MTLRLDATAAEQIAGKHEAAAESIDGSAGSAPTGVDGGAGAAHLLEILQAVSTTAGEIALVNVAIASQVRDVTDGIGLTEQEIAEQFAHLNETLR